jgi:hypothetical protein
MTDNDELKDWIKDARENLHIPIAKEIEELFLSEGVPLPPSTPNKPMLNHVANIPEGVKIVDDELANLVSLNLLLGITYAARGITESIRSDVGLIYAKAIIRKMMHGTTLKPLMDKHGWLCVPPYFKQ